MLFPIAGTVFTYGQTGSGKTFSMIGDTQHYEHRGIAPRAIAHLYSEMSARLETDFDVRCTYVEIYNEKYAQERWHFVRRHSFFA